LFLWIFGAAVEGRIRPFKYICLYLLAGLTGGLVQSLASPIPNFGASGAIMGVAGAYLFMFPFAHTNVFWYFVFKIGIGNWPAWSLICYFVALDIINGFLLHAHDGVAHITHLCGFIIGLLFVLLIKAHSDSEAVSEVQATKHDLGNKLELMSWAELDILLDHPTDNMEMVVAFCNKAVVQPGQQGTRRAVEIIMKHKEQLLEYRDPVAVAQALLKIPPDIAAGLGVFYLSLGRKLEGVARHDVAVDVYRRIVDMEPGSTDAGAAMMRFGRIWETIYRNNDMARDAYEAYINKFPNGPLLDTAEHALARVGGPKVVAPIFRQGTVTKVDLDEPLETSQETVRQADRTAEHLTGANEEPEEVIAVERKDAYIAPPKEVRPKVQFVRQRRVFNDSDDEE
jgi:hypothetical protein